MKSSARLLWGIALGIALMLSCDDKNDEGGIVVNTQPPGKEYVKEGSHCLNVFYYTIEDKTDSSVLWHQEYSQVLLAAQKAYGEQMELNGYGKKTFHLNVNKENPDYVRIIHLRGNVADYSEHGAEGIYKEVKAYLHSHPEEYLSDFTFILAPDVTGREWVEKRMNVTVGMTVLSTLKLPDRIDETNEYIVGAFMQELGSLFYLNPNKESMSEIYYSLMNTGQISGWPRNVRLLKSDAIWLNQNPVFNDKEIADKTEEPAVQVKKTDFGYEDGQIIVNCEFSSKQNIVGVIVYNDPWALSDRLLDIGDSGAGAWDAVAYVTEEVNRNGSDYKISVSMPWRDLPVTNIVPESGSDKREAEIRFRFIMEDGVAVPMGESIKGGMKSGLRYPYVIRNLMPDFNAKVELPAD